ncbi:MAG TPA: glycosyltransferase family 4 protein [Roseiflexaceae bacterium]|nr:glycosyltransferase family 4 protein [Roseiflexaceae bacterium]
MRLLVALTYYRPYTSGLTIYVQRLAAAMTRRGHTVTILTSQYDPSLPERETIDGVRIVRAPVLARVNKGVIMPTIGWLASALAIQHDAMSLHLPQFDVPGLALRGRLLRQPVVLTYHCDLKLAPGLLNRVANTAVDAANNIGAALSTAIVTYTQDYADHSPYLSRFRSKVRVIPPPVELPSVSEAEVRGSARRWNIDGPVIGMVARLAAEKGVEVLLEALPRVLESYPNARVLFAGTYQNVLGEEAYALRLAPMLEKHRDHWTFMGNLSQQELAALYPNLDVVVVPSLNSTESFGMVQVEAMLSGTPAIASALPGVRQPVHQTGMGEVVPIGDSDALASAIVRVLRNRPQYIRPREEIAARYNTERTAAEYEALFEELRR